MCPRDLSARNLKSLPALAGVLLWLAASASAADLSTLEKDFAQPPQSAGIRCWWWWLNGNVTRAAITRDLEAMKAKGFSGACIFDAGGAEQRGNEQVPAGPMFGSPEWRELYKHAIREADRLGLEMSLSIQSGWNLGGPDVTPAEASKHVTWSETRVSGPAAFKQILPRPKMRDEFYREIAVLAVPVKKAEGIQPELAASSARAEFPVGRTQDGRADTFWVSAGVNPGEGPTAARPEWLLFKLASPTTVTGLKLRGRAGYSPKECTLQISSDGRRFQNLTNLVAADGQELTVRFAPVETAHVRLLIRSAYDRSFPTNARNAQVAEVDLLDASGRPMSGRGRAPIRDLVDKAVFHEVGGSAPDTRHLLTDYPAQPDEADAALRDVVNLTGKIAANGTLDWSAPAGEWRVLRFGYTGSGARVSTASGQWQGRVIDHLSADIFRAYWNRHIEPLLQDIGPLAGKTLKYLQTDSWELGGCNWSDNFAAEFQRRRGYDVIPWLPVLAGQILENRDACNRFLADFRKTISDCVSDNHYRVFAEEARKHGLGIQPESAGPHAGPFDGLKNYGHSEIMMSEFWVPSPHRPRPENRFFVKQASSAAHIYNKRLVGAESFTSIGPHWNDTLWQGAKPSFNHEICNGLNLVLLHTFTCSPPEMGRPGQEYFAGTHFNPQVTWWNMADGFITYMARAQVLMQQGQFVGDALYYYGDHVPNIARLKEDDPARVLPGFDYDVINEDRLLALSFNAGRITLPHGLSYRVIVLPDHGVLSLAALRKVHALVRAGATVIGPKTQRIMSLENYPACNTELKKLAGELWGDANQPVGENRLGAGRAIWGKTAREVMLADGVTPDFTVMGEAPKPPPAGAGKWVIPDFDYIHHTLDGGDYYFVCNHAPEPKRITAAFRVTGKQPELWDPLTGERRPAKVFSQEAGRTVIPLEFDAHGALFIVFRQPISASQQGTGTGNFPTYQPVQALAGPWQVRFDPQWGGPVEVTFDKLISWTDRPEPGIRHYSGTAVYTRQFDCPPATAGQPLWLELGDLRDVGMARVRVNGQDCGVAWTPPFRVDIARAVKPGANALEITVANSWRNRLLADDKLPAAQRLTQTNIRVKPDWQPVASGLLGPVRVMVRQNP